MKPLRLNRRQRRIEERLLRLVGPGVAAFFRDACRLMEEPDLFESTSHQVGHLVREIESALRDVLQTLAPSEKGQTAGHEKSIRLILDALEINTDHPLAVKWLRHATGEDNLPRRAHRSSLSPVRKIDDEFKTFWEDMQAVFDEVLDRFEKRYVEVRERVDTLVAMDNPTAADATFLQKSIPNNLVGHGYFFEKLQNPAWMPLLDKEGMFSDPPDVDLDDPERGASSPPWPSGQYLARIAKISAAQDRVLEILLLVPSTKNPAVHETVAEAALGLPSSKSVRLVPRLTGWLSGSTRGFFRQKVADLVVTLANGGESDAAFTLAVELFAVVSSEGDKAIAQGHARSTLDDFEYRQLLDKCRPALMAANTSKTIDLLCGLLIRTLEATNDRPGSDHSAVWRQAVESDAEDRPWSIQGALVSSIRDCVREAAAADSASMPTLVGKLEESEYPIFRRLALDLLAQAPASNVALVEERFRDTSRWDETERHEYATLVRAAFPYVSDAARQTFLSWIESGPDVSSLTAGWEVVQGARPAQEQVERYRRQWQRDRLAPFKDILPGAWKVRYAALVAAEGEADHPEFPFFTRVWSGPTSPVTTDNLAAMTIEQIIDHLRTWKPSSDWMSPSVEGLGRQLSAAVARDPARFAAAARSFEGLDATYVRSVFNGVLEGLQAGKVFDWEGLVVLAGWVAAQPRSAEDEKRSDRNSDPHWGWARKAIANLFQTGFHSKSNEVPFSLRREVWEVLAAIVEDPNPTPDHEAQYGGENMDPAMMSINTTRGQALHAVVDYALWVSRHEPGGAPRDFGKMPEVSAVLEGHLDRGTDPSTTARAVYGWHLGQLVYLDTAWVADHLEVLFPTAPEDSSRRDTVWETYLAFNPVGTHTWPLLEREYRRAVESLSASRKRLVRRSLGADPIVQHVMQLYWHGVQGLEDGSLVARFFEVAPEELRHEALDYVGRSLEPTNEEDISDEVIARVKALWKKRFEAGLAEPTNHAKELSAFGWWAKAETLDLDWRFEQLMELLTRIGRVDPGFIVMEMLADAALTRPKQAVDCLAAMVDAEQNRFESAMWSAESKLVLKRALASSDPAAISAARELISVLEARGYPGFRELL